MPTKILVATPLELLSFLRTPPEVLFFYVPPAPQNILQTS